MTDTPITWTLDELAERADAALSVGYDGQSSGRVREVPDQRAIRYYTTLGLVDRPIARRGSTVLYGPRHLLQLVAIKKLQARGLPLARIQVELAGATDEQLQRVAQLPRQRIQPAARLMKAAPPAGLAGAPAPSRAFWKRAAGAERPAAAGLGTTGPGTTIGRHPAGEATEGDSGAALLQGVRLADGVTLLLDQARPLRQDDVQAIQAAAAGLLEALRARGLGGRTGGREPR
jgi:DNA-binding transcriptional MerR regulator